MGGVNSAREQDSSIGGDAGYVCLGVCPHGGRGSGQSTGRSGREEQGVGETHGKEQSEERRSNEQRSTAHHGWHEDDVSARWTDTFSGSS